MYYAWANRYRGSKSKSLGYLFLMLPTLIAINFVLFGHWIWMIGFTVIYLLHTLIIFKWFWGSDYWSGWYMDVDRPGDLKALERVWLWKSIAGFALLGQPWLGIPMKRAGKIYIDAREDIESAELKVGALYGKLIMIATLCLAFYLWYS